MCLCHKLKCGPHFWATGPRALKLHVWLLFWKSFSNNFICQIMWPLPSFIIHVLIQRRGGGQGIWAPHLKNHKNIEFLSNIGLYPLKITKLPSQHSMLGQHRHASETTFKWRFSDFYQNNFLSTREYQTHTLQKIPLFWCSFYRDTRFCHEKDAQNVVTGWFFTKKWSKWRNSSETLHNEREIFIGSSKHQ